MPKTNNEWVLPHAQDKDQLSWKSHPEQMVDKFSIVPEDKQ